MTALPVLRGLHVAQSADNLRRELANQADPTAGLMVEAAKRPTTERYIRLARHLGALQALALRCEAAERAEAEGGGPHVD